MTPEQSAVWVTMRLKKPATPAPGGTGCSLSATQRAHIPGHFFRAVPAKQDRLQAARWLAQTLWHLLARLQFPGPGPPRQAEYRGGMWPPRDVRWPACLGVSKA